MSSEGAPSAEHQQLVRALIEYLRGRGWTITHADGVAGYQQPYLVGERRPDVIAQNTQGLLAFGEAETCDFLESEQTIGQIDVFSNRVMTSNRQDIPFFIVVPKACGDRLARLVQTRFSSRTNINQLVL